MAKSRRNRKGQGAGRAINRAPNAKAQSARDAAKLEAMSLVNAGNAKLDAGDYDGAIADCERAIAIDSEVALARRNRWGIACAYARRGNDRTNRGDYDSAREDYERAIDLRTNSWPGSHVMDEAVGYWTNIQPAVDRGDYDTAITYCERAIGLLMIHASVYNSRGWARHCAGDDDGAIADCGFAIHLISRYPNLHDDDEDVLIHYLAHSNRGVAKCSKGDYDGAIADYDLAIGLNPDFALAYNNRGIAKERQGDYDGAITDFDLAVDLEPSYANAYRNRGDAKTGKGDYDGANEDYERANALRQSPKLNENSTTSEVSSLLERAATLLMAGEHYEAIVSFDGAIALDPNFAPAYGGRGDAIT